MRADCSTRTEKSCSQGFYPCLALRAKTQVTSTRNVTARVVASVQCRSQKCRNTRNAQNPAGLTSAVPCLLVSSSPRAKDDMIAYPLYSSVSQSCPAHGIADWCHLCCNAVAYTRNGPHEDSLPISSLVRSPKLRSPLCPRSCSTEQITTEKVASAPIAQPGAHSSESFKTPRNVTSAVWLAAHE